jgi:hypothetical protein
MSVEIVEAANGLVTVKVTGKLTRAEQTEFQKRVVALSEREGRVNVLVLAQDFQGWDKDDWGDLGFQAEFDQHLGKMAIVGDKKWADLAVLFTGKGLRRVEIEMFPDTEQAHAWLGAKA